MRTTLKLLTVLGGRGHPLLESLVSYWELNETSGTRYDAHGTNHLTDNNTVGYAAGVVGNAASFVDANSEFLSISSNSTLQIGDVDLTIAGWIYADTLPTTTTVVSKRGEVGALEYYLRTESGYIAWRCTHNGTNGYSVLSADPISTSAWYWLVVWHDSINNLIGVQVNNGTPQTAAATQGIFSGASDFRIGGYGSEGWDGRIDQVGFWKRVLTAAERTWLYNAGAGRAYAAL